MHGLVGKSAIVAGAGSAGFINGQVLSVDGGLTMR
jgi:hypothetical protein